MPDAEIGTRRVTRDKLLAGGFDLLFDRGFEESGVKQITDACGVPKGSFYYYFESKEAFALEVLDVYLRFMRTTLEQQLVNGDGPHLTRLQRLFDSWTKQAARGDFRRGCLAGTLCQEMAPKNAAFREKTDRVFEVLQQYFEASIHAAQQAGEMSTRDDPAELAEFVLNGWQGALLRMKASRCREPLTRFRSQIFGKVLR